jgi:6-phosphogluconolactonase
MGKYIIEKFENAAALATTAARNWLQRLSDHPSRNYYAAFSGGRIAKSFFAAITQEAKERRSTLEPIHFFWADERCVPPDDAESNFRIAREDLFQPLDIQEDQIHRIKGELQPENAARMASEEICRIVPARKNEYPVLDIIFLGMGEDGHVASLFPRGREMPRQIYLPVVASKPPPNRVTLSYEMIAHANEVWVLASGSGKENALRESLSDQGTTPLAKVIRMRSKTTILTDTALS